MIGPISVSGANGTQTTSPLVNQEHTSGDTVDNPAQSVSARQALQLRVDKVELTNEAQKAQFRNKEQQQEQRVDRESAGIEPAMSSAGVTFRILRDLSNRIQSRIVDKNTQEVIKSVPPESLVKFYQQFRKMQDQFE